MLVWLKEQEITKQDTTVRVKVLNNEGLNLFLNDSSNDYLLGQAINGENGCQLVLDYIGWSFAFGNNYQDWALTWFL